MSTDLAERRKEELAEQFAHIQQRIEDTNSLTHQQVNTLLDEIRTEFDKAEQRQSDLEETIDQDPTESQFRRVYRPFVRQLDGIQDRLLDLQQALLYLETNYQQQEVYADRLDYVSKLCAELDALFHHNVDYLPVVWDGYAAFDIQFQEFYAVHIPRDESTTLGSPIVAHELGHAVVDHMDQEDKQPFYDRLRTIVDDWAERKQPLVRRTWREWFKELVCDACGLLTFGPAYVLAMTERLCHSNPFRLPSPSTVQAHPPDALRFKYVDDFAEDVLPDELYTRTHSACEDFELHLQQVVRGPPPEYESWLDEELFDSVRSATRRSLESDLDSLCTNILDEGNSTGSGQQELRLEANRMWLDRQTGG